MTRIHNCKSICLLVGLFLSTATSASDDGTTSQTPRSVTCKAVPGSQGWPSQQQWSQLNQSLSQPLLAPSPPALPCDINQASTYNQQQCAVVGQQWSNGSFFNQDPVSAHYPNWQDDACLPTAVYNGTTQCNIEPFPLYVVNATNANDIAAAVQFASANEVRLSIRGTGHDFLGRSSAPGLSIWTHNLRGIDMFTSFVPNGCTSCNGTTAMNVSAGHTNCEIYQAAKPYGVIPVVGQCPTVGMGGYLTGGGHSPISVKYGLAVDNILEMVVVTATGDILTANEYQNQDLFWALRGGGGSTFGVVVSAVLTTYPAFPITRLKISFSSTPAEAMQNNNSNWYSTLAYFHSQIPKLTNNYITGYFNMYPLASLGPGGTVVPFSTVPPNANTSGPMNFLFTGSGLSMSKKRATALLAPLKRKFASESSLTSSIKLQSGTIYDIIQSCSFSLGAGNNLIVGSRLWDLPAVTNQQGLIHTYQALDPPVANGYMISGPGIRNAPNPNATSANPAWRSTYLHITTALTFNFDDSSQQQSAARSLTYGQTAALRNMAPNTGSYLNEADVNEPDHQQAFWGNNYAQLLQIKNKYDPQGVFWCSVCVGAEQWNLDPDSGQLCSVS